jgi:LysR family glycine cleavage system transcriptional activator
VPLFRRMTRALLLTDAGQAALPLLRDGFDMLAEGAGRIAARRADDVLTVSVGPSFAAKWLVPRLDRFRAAHSQLDVRIDANDDLVDFRHDGVDVAVRYGSGAYPGLRSDCLFDELVVPVCSPALLTGAHPIRTPEDLRHHALLHLDWRMEDEAAPNWRMWLLAAGVEGIDPTRGPRFNYESMAVQAAIEGHGVTLADRVLVADDLAAGRLVMPFELSLPGPTRFCYFLVSPESTADLPKIAAFRDWILAEATAQAKAGAAD